MRNSLESPRNHPMLGDALVSDEINGLGLWASLGENIHLCIPCVGRSRCERPVGTEAECTKGREFPSSHCLCSKHFQRGTVDEITQTI